MRRLNPGDVSAKLGRIAESSRSRRWKKAARRHLMRDMGAYIPPDGHMIELPHTESTVCTKRRFTTLEAAHAALEAAQNSPNPTRNEQRYYQCNGCGAWHLTSLEDIHHGNTQEQERQRSDHHVGLSRH